jgi:hypothetical protein
VKAEHRRILLAADPLDQLVEAGDRAVGERMAVGPRQQVGQVDVEAEPLAAASSPPKPSRDRSARSGS